ncbi:unnamed protein product [Callosobruchus maculatus]|uniref:Uncharacterized protein n=1 Tax=Callosobruchus maculatus TaxID=64391 RepID=A0A653BQK3_CALMS|nr:unnamed protein product [Callosobruchus maculatus]
MVFLFDWQCTKKSYLFTWHNLQSRAFRLVFTLAFAEIHTKMNTILAMIYTNLHVIVTYTVYQKTLQVERCDCHLTLEEGKYDFLFLVLRRNTISQSELKSAQTFQR